LKGAEELDHVVSLEQLTTLLHQQALTGTIDFGASVSAQVLPEEAATAFNVFFGHAWEATRFRFTYGWFLLDVRWF